MSAASKLVTAMHTAAGTRGRYVSGWITLAQTDDSLRAAVRAVFGKRIPTPQKLGQWLSDNVGPHGELILEGTHSARKKAWAYRVATPAEVAESQRKREASDTVSRQEAQRREFERQAVRDARLDRAKGKGRSTATITQTAPDPPAPGFFEPINPNIGSSKSRPAPEPAPEKPMEPERPTTRVEEMRERYLRNHASATPSNGGFYNPGGVVSRNMSREGGIDLRTRKLRLLDF